MKELKLTISSWISLDLYKEIDEISEKANISKSELLRQILSEHITNNPTKSKRHD